MSQPLKKAHADKGYFDKFDWGFLHLNDIENGAMRKDALAALLTENLKKGSIGIGKEIVEQNVRVINLYDFADHASFIIIPKNVWDHWSPDDF